jgi:hypothetical protein
MVTLSGFSTMKGNLAAAHLRINCTWKLAGAQITARSKLERSASAMSV